MLHYNKLITLNDHSCYIQSLNKLLWFHCVIILIPILLSEKYTLSWSVTHGVLDNIVFLRPGDYINLI